MSRERVTEEKKPGHKERARKGGDRANTAKKPISPERISSLRALVDTYRILQKARIAWGNRQSAVNRGQDEPLEADPCAEGWNQEFYKLEHRCFSQIQRELQSHPVWYWLKTQKGIGPTLAGKLLADIDFAKARHISSLWKFAGLYPGARLVKGQKSPFNHKLRAVCFLIARSFIMGGKSPYLAHYVEAKQFYKANRPDWTPLTVELAARRKMVKRFLADLWIEGRKAEGLSVTPPYAHRNEQGGE